MTVDAKPEAGDQKPAGLVSHPAHHRVDCHLEAGEAYLCAHLPLSTKCRGQPASLWGDGDGVLTYKTDRNFQHMTAWGCERAGGGDIKSSGLLQIETDRQTDRQTDSFAADRLPADCTLYTVPDTAAG